MNFDLITLKYVLENNPSFRNKIANRLSETAMEYAVLASNLDNNTNTTSFTNISKNNSDASRQIKTTIKDLLKNNNQGLTAIQIYKHVVNKTNTTIARNSIYWYLNSNKNIVKQGRLFKLKTTVNVRKSKKNS